MDRVVQWLPDIAPYLAGVLALLTTASQLSLAPRLRRLETWARSAQEGESSEARSEALARIERVAIARLVSRAHVPTYHAVGQGTQSDPSTDPPKAEP